MISHLSLRLLGEKSMSGLVLEILLGVAMGKMPDGTALYRGMTRDEYERYKKL